MSDPGELTALLQSAAKGSHTASRKLIDVIHSDLKQVARSKMLGEPENHTLQPTAVINEVFLRLFHPAAQGSGEWLLNSMEIQSRSHFRSIAAAQMRLLLIDHARAKKASKRNFGVRIPLEDANPVAETLAPGMDVEELDKHLTVLERRDPRAAKVVEMKFFGGMTDKEVAAQMAVSFATVRRDWEFARRFLRQRIQNGQKSE